MRRDVQRIPGAAQGNRLRAVRRVVGDVERGSPYANSRWAECNLHRTTGANRDCRSAEVGHKELPHVGAAQCNAVEVESLAARVGKGDVQVARSAIQLLSGKVKTRGRD